MTTVAENIELSNTNLFLFKSDLTNGKEIRVVGTAKNPLFIGKDIAEILGYKNTRDALIKHVKPNHKKTLNSNVVNHNSLNLRSDTVLIDEAGLYSLVLRSKLKEAEFFQEWVISEVLPSIRKSGQYKLQQELLLKDDIIKTITTEHNTLLSDHQTLKKNHNNILKRRNRTDFDTGNVIYIVSHEAFDLCYNTSFYKIGKSTQKKGEKTACFRQRLSTYNTGAPVNFKVHYLLYVEDNDIIEKNLKVSYAKNLDPSNKEWIRDINLDNIIIFLRNLCVLLKIDYKEVVFENNDSNILNIEPKVEEEEKEEEKEEEDRIQDEEKEDEAEDQQEISARKCRKCNKNKKIDMFKRHGPYGRSYICLECDKFYERKPDTCLDCNVTLLNTSSKKCDTCAAKDTRYKERPSYERLKKDLEIMSYVACGKKYGVSDNSIRKWIRTYQGKPTRRPVFKV